MFFRVKKIKGKEYAYTVENQWKRAAKSVHALPGVKPRGSRQRVKCYLGRAYRLNLINEAGFLQFKKIENIEDYIKENSFKRIIHGLIEWELFKHGVDRNIFTIDLNEPKVKQNGKNAVLLMNEGFMCNLTLRNVFEFRPEGNESDDGYRLARALVEVGIKIPTDIFIGLFGKLFKRQ